MGIAQSLLTYGGTDAADGMFKSGMRGVFFCQGCNLSGFFRCQVDDVAGFVRIQPQLGSFHLRGFF